MEQCCGTCQYHKADDCWPSDWVCTNADSENCADFTEWEDWCEQYEEREAKKDK